MSMAAAQPRCQSPLEFATFPLPVSGSVESVAHEDARIEHLLEFPTLLISDQFESRHGVLSQVPVTLLQRAGRLCVFHECFDAVTDAVLDQRSAFHPILGLLLL